MAQKKNQQMMITVIAIVVIIAGIFFYNAQKPKVLVADCKVHLGDFDWDSANVHTAIASYILDKGYDCEVQVTKGSTTPIMAALFDQQIDIITEVWRDNLVQLIEDNLSKGNIIELGINTPSSTQGFYVDKPTADKYGLKHVDDMKKPEIAKLFSDPEAPGKGRMTSCISGWTCYTINLVKHKVYGLDEYYTNFDPGSGGALDAAIAGAFKKKQPVFSYYWTPTGLMGKVDLVQLEEPKYDADCWNKMTKVVEDIKANGPDVYKETCACAYVDMALTKAASTKFANNAKNKPIIDFIKAYSIPTAAVNKSLAFYMDESGGDMEETAKNFLSSNSSWESWVPEEVVKKVKASL
jgi:glycine betaine/proline transport system substrate-binding protein|tara:strand:+ start:73 stop:1128 length:1056 start_codon:yes stop_codon:yes gene_type:complete